MEEKNIAHDIKVVRIHVDQHASGSSLASTFMMVSIPVIVWRPSFYGSKMAQL